MDIDSPFDEGWQAYEEHGECPYPPMSLERMEWLKGYDAALDAYLAENDMEDWP